VPMTVPNSIIAILVRIFFSPRNYRSSQRFPASPATYRQSIMI